MVKKRPLNLKKAKRACSICGSYKPGDVFSFSKEREHRNSVLICKNCVSEIAKLADTSDSKKYLCPVCKKEFTTEKGLLIHQKKSGNCLKND